MQIPRSWRAGAQHLAWNRPGLTAPDTITLDLPDVGADRVFHPRHAGKGVGDNVSPALTWAGAPDEAASLWLIVQDPDAPIPRPPVHLSTLIDAAPRGRLDEGALARGADAAGVTLLKGMFGPGWNGPRPVRGHGPHAYVFQLFALDLDTATAQRVGPRGFAGHVIARGRTEATFERV